MNIAQMLEWVIAGGIQLLHMVREVQTGEVCPLHRCYSDYTQVKYNSCTGVTVGYRQVKYDHCTDVTVGIDR